MDNLGGEGDLSGPLARGAPSLEGDAHDGSEGGLLTKMRVTLTEHAMAHTGDCVLVGFSGGPDSCALLHALWSIRVSLGIRVEAAHFNHCLRGAESDRDEEYAAALCRDMNIRYHAGRADVPAASRRRGVSVEVAARDLRHAFLRNTAEQCGAQAIALAHTQSDRVETVLLNLLRGTGAAGLGGFPPVDGMRIRPLYRISRADVLQYCAANRLTPRTDSSNTDLRYRRNRVRAELLPYFKTYYNENIDAVIIRMADIIRDDDTALDALAAEALDAAVISGEGILSIEWEAITRRSPAIARRMVRMMIARVRGHTENVPFRFIEEILEACRQGIGGAWNLPWSECGQVGIKLGAGALTVYHLAACASVRPWEYVLPAGGSVYCAPCDITISSVGDSGNMVGPSEREAIWLPTASTAFPLTVRSRRPGDRIELSFGTKKVQDLFINRKVPASQRDSIPIIVDNSGRLLWIPGVAVCRLGVTEVSEAAGYMMLAAHHGSSC